MFMFQKGQIQPLMAVALGSVIIASGVVVARQVGWIGPHAAANPIPSTVADMPPHPPLGANMPRERREAEHHLATRDTEHRNTEQASYPDRLAYAGNQGQPPIAPPPCPNCGVIASIHQVQIAGSDSGLGAVAGGVAGGVIGHQVGNGNGRTVATILGALGGAFAGNTVEKHERQTTEWKVNVHMEDGSDRVYTLHNPPSLSSGEPVRVQGDQILPR
ncbi:MAG: glycine zipper 2TM domain-containing protein [Pseudomonadales bacterium]|nr:glycine zipper 2TM domain-containing protein [Pseudomonadales bacterium]